MQGVGTMAAQRWAMSPVRRVRLSLSVLCAAALLAACGGSGQAQQAGQPVPMSGGPTVRGFPQDSGPWITNGGEEVDTLEAEKRLNALNAERQKSMVSDTEKLYKLAAELNKQIAQSNSGALTPDQMRMVAEIEKLAHNVRDKMTMSLRGPQFPGMDAPFQPFSQANRH
jgi:hypothetical protein